MVLRQTFVDGDHLILPQQDLSLQLIEGHQLTSPDNLQDDVVHGVRVDTRTGRPLEYFFLGDKPGQRKWHGRRVPASYQNEDLIRIPAFSENRPNVFHIFNPQRVSQTRGVTAFRAVFDLLGMFEDINFARLVQQQVVSCVAVFLTRERDYQWGNRTTEDEEDGTTTYFEELSPGLVARLKPGEKAEGFSPAVPNPEFFDHVRLVLRLVGMALGMPLELVTLDTTDTTFHGYRGALDQARISFRRIQKWYSRLFHRRVYQMLVRAWSPELLVGRTAQRVGNGKLQLMRHEWHGRGWPYVEPKLDAEADTVRLRNGLTSPRRVHAERSGSEWKQIQKEIVEDYGMAIKNAVAEAEKINQTLDDDSLQPKVTWRDVLNLDAPQGMTRQEKITGVDPAGGPDPNAPAPAPKSKKVVK
jgi:capsid protein